jgi:hypothetical protein
MMRDGEECTCGEKFVDSEVYQYHLPCKGPRPVNPKLGRPRVELAGLKFGKLTVIEFRRHPTLRSDSFWLCSCECGGTIVTSGHRLKIGRTVSCGCVKRSIIAKLLKDSIIHNDHGSPEYISWIAMRRRCDHKKNINYDRYGGRGIKVCERWSSYENFLSDMGRKPSNSHSIDRIDVNGDYEPCNVKWSTPKEQCNNRSNTIYVMYKGNHITLTEAIKLGGANVARNTFQGRIKAGWSVEDAVEKPVKVYNKS